MNLGKMLEESCAIFPDRIAVIHRENKLTFSALHRAVNSLANRLERSGIGREDKVTIMLPNIPEFVISYFAIQKVGGVAVTINTSSTSFELKYLLDNSDSRLLITTENLQPRFDAIQASLSTRCGVLSTKGLGMPSSFTEAIQSGPSEHVTPYIRPDDPAVMIYTAGLTGKPLGAVLTHRNLLTQSELLRGVFSGTPDDRSFCIIPLFHSFGAAANMLCPIRIGAGMVMLDQFLMDDIFRTIEIEKVTYVCSVPRLYLGMLFHPGGNSFNLSSLRFCITGGSAIPPHCIADFQKRFNVGLFEGYGLTEAAPVCSVARMNMPQKPGSIGIGIPEVELKIFGEDGRELPRGETGELVVRGPNVMKGYYKEEKATASVIRDGWLHTGDLALMDEDGYVFLKGLMKRMIITSGFNVYPREVEIVLDMHPAVRKSRVIGKPDLMRGEIVKALIVPATDSGVDEKSVLKHCRTYLSSYKVPREIEIVKSLD